MWWQTPTVLTPPLGQPQGVIIADPHFPSPMHCLPRSPFGTVLTALLMRWDDHMTARPLFRMGVTLLMSVMAYTSSSESPPSRSSRMFIRFTNGRAPAIHSDPGIKSSSRSEYTNCHTLQWHDNIKCQFANDPDVLGCGKNALIRTFLGTHFLQIYTMLTLRVWWWTCTGGGVQNCTCVCVCVCVCAVVLPFSISQLSRSWSKNQEPKTGANCDHFLLLTLGAGFWVTLQWVVHHGWS